MKSVSSPAGATKKRPTGLPVPEKAPALSFVVDLPLPCKILSPNVRAHWAVKAAATKRHRTDAGFLFKIAKPKGWKPVPVEISVEYRCPKGSAGYVAHDEQNAKSSLKAAVDAMVDAGIIPTDSHRWLTWGDFVLVTSKRDRAIKDGGEGVTIMVRARA